MNGPELRREWAAPRGGERTRKFNGNDTAGGSPHSFPSRGMRAESNEKRAPGPRALGRGSLGPLSANPRARFTTRLSAGPYRRLAARRKPPRVRAIPRPARSGPPRQRCVFPKFPRCRTGGEKQRLLVTRLARHCVCGPGKQPEGVKKTPSTAGLTVDTKLLIISAS